MKKATFAMVLGSLVLTSVMPVTAFAGGGHAIPGVRVNVRVQVRAAVPFVPPRHVVGFAHHGFRPICRVGGVGPGCFAPVRKTARFIGRVGVRAVRGVAFAAALPFRLLFGRRFR